MRPERRREIGGWALQMGLALLVAAGVVWVWPRLPMAMLGREELWFALGWLVLLGLPPSLSLLGWTRTGPDPTQTIDDEVLGHVTLALGLIFVALLAAAPGLGNYKLWLGTVYLAALVARLGGMALVLRSRLIYRPRRIWQGTVAAGLLSALACWLLVPWVRPDLVAQWPPSLPALARPLAAGGLWGMIAAGTLLFMTLMGGTHRLRWLTYLAVGLGPGATLAVTWFPLTPMLIAGLILAGLAALRMAIRRRPEAQVAPGLSPLSLYWLLRALVIFWLGVGVAVALAASWWRPQMATLFTESLWLRALALGGFLVGCLGLLAEHALPLMGRADLGRLGRERKVLGVMLTALALLAAFAPLLLTRPYVPHPAPPFLADPPRAELLAAPVTLDPDNPDLVLEVPSWLQGLSQVFVVSLLANGAEVDQGKAVAQLTALDDLEMPHIYHLRAGIDTAEWALNKRDVAGSARHRPARVADQWIIYAPTGEAFMAQSYFTGLYLGSAVNQLSSVRLRYRYQNPPGSNPVKVEIRRVFVN